MNSIIQELQSEAYDPKISTSNLLRKAYIVAKKLKITEFAEWLHEELNGYESYNTTPNYRDIKGDLRAWNPYQGWVPAIINDTELSSLASSSKVMQSIPELERLAQADSNGMVMQFADGLRNQLSEMFGVETNFQLHFGKSQIEKIIESVRNIVLDWALKLEEDGILGEGLSFTKEEKEKAKKNEYNVNNYYGDIQNSQIQQNTTNSNQYMNFENIKESEVLRVLKLIKENLDSIEFNETDGAVVGSEIQTIDAQLKSPKPNKNIIGQSLKTIRNLMEGMSGSLIASGVLYQIDQLIK